MKSCLFVLMALTLLETPEAYLDVIDLSHRHGPDVIPFFPEYPRYKLTILQSGIVRGGDFYIEDGAFETAEHSGTHMDAPKHIQRGGLGIDEVPLQNTITEGVMIDCSREASQQRDYEVPLQKILDWERENGRIPDRAAVIFNFGWFRLYGDQNAYRGTNDVADYLTFVFPSVSIEAARFLVKERDMLMIGTDTLSPDKIQVNGQLIGIPIHDLMLPQSRPIVENLNNLDKLPPRGFLFSAAPVKYVDGTGPQVRAYAVILDDNSQYGFSPRLPRPAPTRRRPSRYYWRYQ